MLGLPGEQEVSYDRTVLSASFWSGQELCLRPEEAHSKTRDIGQRERGRESQLSQCVSTPFT